MRYPEKLLAVLALSAVGMGDSFGTEPKAEVQYPTNDCRSARTHEADLKKSFTDICMPTPISHNGLQFHGTKTCIDLRKDSLMAAAERQRLCSPKTSDRR